MNKPGNTLPSSNDNDHLRAMIIAGDPSGDIHSSHVVKALKERQPHCAIFGIGGEKMVSAGFETLFPLEKMAVMGFIEVLKHLKFFADVNRRLLEVIEQRKPQVIVLVDYPGFNIRFAQRFRQRFHTQHDYKPKLLYFISPQVWAWKPNRINIIARVMDFMAVAFPFEVELYQKAGLPVEFVGHPLLDLPDPRSKEELFRVAGIGADSIPIAILSGSRIQEVERHLPVFLEAFSKLNHEHPKLYSLVAASDNIPMEFYQRFIPKNLKICVLQGWTREIMAHSHAACVVSGTATVETALFGTPSVIAYKTNPLTYWIAKQVVRVPYIGMVNILAGDRIVNELIQNQVTPENLAQEMESLIYDKTRRNTMIANLQQIRSQLGQPGAGQRVAEKILELANAN